MDVSMRTDAQARRVGLAVGLLLAAVAVLSWRIGAEGAPLGTAVSFLAAPPGELTAAPAGEFVSARGLEPGETARGRLQLRNVAGGRVEVRLRARPSARELDRPLMVRLQAAGRTVFRGRLGSLRAWTRALTIPRGEVRSLDVRAWLARPAVGASVDVTIELRAEVGRG
jgi:hypothetical protein